jgi:hypothetical protein
VHVTVGKTTVARKFGEVYYSLGILPSSDVVELSVSDLMTGYVGQTGQQTREKFSAARGKVLFVDEAYQLNPRRGGPYAQEAVDEIVKCLTHPDFKQNMVVIFAGYLNDIEEMLNVNSGLQSRFQEKIHFEDFSPSKARGLLESRLVEKKLELDEECREKLGAVMKDFVSIPNFANGRDVETFVDRILKVHISTDSDDKFLNGCSRISYQSLCTALQTMVSDRKSAGDSRNGTSAGPISAETSPAVQFATSLSKSQPPPAPPARRRVASSKQRDQTPPPPRDDAVEPLIEEQPSEFDLCFENVLNKLGHNTAEGVKRLSGLSPNDITLQDLAQRVATRLDISIGEATSRIIDWQGKQRDVQRLIEDQEIEIENAKKQKRKAKVPIWQCQACLQACKPFIVCHYMPRIIRYDEIDV